MVLCFQVTVLRALIAVVREIDVSAETSCVMNIWTVSMGEMKKTAVSRVILFFIFKIVLKPVQFLKTKEMRQKGSTLINVY